MTTFRYDYVPPEELGIKKLLKEGEAGFKVTAVSDRNKDGNALADKNGSPMVKLTMKVTDTLNASTLVDEYLTGSFAAKIKAFADSVGLPGLYNPSGVLDISKLVGLTGNCMIKTDSFTGFDGNERKSTKVAKFLVAQKHQDVPDDELPF